MNREQRLDANYERMAETASELARLERVLGTARLAQPRSERVQQLENEAAAVRSTLQALTTERIDSRSGAAERTLASKTTPATKRQRLTELIDDIRRYSTNCGGSQQFKEETDRMLRDAVVRRADIARDAGVKVRRRIANGEMRWIIDDMLEARLLNAGGESRRDLKLIARATTDVLKDLGVLRPEIDTGKVREILWTIMKGIIGAAAGSGAMALYHILSTMDVSGQARAAAQVYDDAWSANRDSVQQASSLFAEPIPPKAIFGLLFHLSRAL